MLSLMNFRYNHVDQGAYNRSQVYVLPFVDESVPWDIDNHPNDRMVYDMMMLMMSTCMGLGHCHIHAYSHDYDLMVMDSSHGEGALRW
jgi:hypothetical protein